MNMPSPFTTVQKLWEYRHEPENMRTLGHLYWGGLLCLCALVLLAVIWFGYAELTTVMQAENVTAPSSKPQSPLELSLLQSTLNTYSARQAQFESLSQSPLSQVPDPSK